jgi:hypothetical protein
MKMSSNFSELIFIIQSATELVKEKKQNSDEFVELNETLKSRLRNRDLSDDDEDELKNLMNKLLELVNIDDDDDDDDDDDLFVIVDKVDDFFNVIVDDDNDDDDDDDDDVPDLELGKKMTMTFVPGLGLGKKSTMTVVPDDDTFRN